MAHYPILVSWPTISTPFSIFLPLSPSLGESTTVSCASLDPNGSLHVNLAPLQLPCASPASSACAAIPSSPSEAAAPLVINFTASAKANSSFTSAIICTLKSTPLALSSTAGLPYPHYGLSTTLPPLPTNAVQFSLPLLAAVLRESTTSPGTFTVAGGGGVGVGSSGATLSLPATLSALATACPGPLSTYAQGFSFTSQSLWSNGTLVTSCPAALQALKLLADSLTTITTTTAASTSAPSSFSGTLSGSRHLLLIASPLTPFPPAASLSATLGGIPCTINYAQPSFASILSPPLSALCINATDATSADCGLATLILSYSTSFYLPLPAAYPPLLPSADWPSQLAALAANPAPNLPTPLSLAASLIGMPLPLLLASSAALAPQGTGLRIVTRCTDPTYAPPELCAVINGAQPLLANSSGLLCVWGTGEACLPCPPGALCPGGAQLLPLPGHWCPSPTSPPSDLYSCPEPFATVRCPGYSAISSTAGVYGCGAGYRGQVCAACAAGLYALRGACAPCPPFSTLALLQPLLVFAAGLCACGAALAALVGCTLARSRRGRVTVGEALFPVANLLVWAWIAAQGLASLFAQAQSLAPEALGPLYSAAAALQFQGIALDPACYSSIPFQSFFVALALALLCYAMGALALCSLRLAPSSQFYALPLKAAALVLTLGYGALTSEFASALVCTTPTPISVNDYLQMANDGSALLAHFSIPPAKLPALLAASRNPLLAAASGSIALLQAAFPVSVVASNTYQVCGEASHRTVRPLAYAMCALVTLGLPLLQLAALWATGHLKCLRRAMAAHCQRPSASLAPTTPALPQQPLLIALCASLTDGTLLPNSAWFSALQQLQLALITGFIALSRARLSLPLYLACQAGIFMASLGLCTLVARLRLFKATEAWKWPVVCLLAIVTGTSAVMNALLLWLKGSAGAVAFSSIPLALAVITLICLLATWWQNLWKNTFGVATASSGVEECVPVGEGVRPRPAEALWIAVTDSDGDCFWYNAALQASEWVLPNGAKSTCGWQQDKAGRWVNEATGASTALPPKAVAARYAAAVGATPSLMMSSAPLEPEAAQTEVLSSPPSFAAQLPSSLPLPHDSSPLTHDAWIHHQPFDQPPFWHHPLTGISARTLPLGAQTACGWTQVLQVDSEPLWRHLGSGALRSTPPPAGERERKVLTAGASERGAMYSLGHRNGDEWVRTDDESGWRQPSNGFTALELPNGARTACGWWQERIGMWLHVGSGATSRQPPSLKSQDAAALIRAHLCAMEAAQSLL